MAAAPSISFVSTAWLITRPREWRSARDGKPLETLVPTGDSEPDVLAASAPVLAPGQYQLHWQAKSVPDGDFSDGFITFTVAR